MLRAFFGILLVSIGAAGSAQAWEYSTEGIAGASGLAQVETILFDFDTEVELSLLLGEPVINTRMRWEIEPSQSLAEIPALDAGESPFITVPLYDLGSAAYDKIRLYNVVLQFQFSTSSGQTLYLAQDAGDLAVGDGQEWSFNVSGSPDWDEVFYRSPLLSSDGQRSYFPAAVSQQGFVEQLRLEDVTILTAEVSFFDLHNWYAQSSPEAEASALARAYTTAAAGVHEAFGLEVDVEADLNWQPPYVDESASGSRMRQFEAVAEHLRGRLARLANIPQSFRAGGNEDTYLDALQAADEIVRNAVQFSFASPDRDPATFREGGASSFGGRESVGGPYLVVFPRRFEGGDYVSVTYRDGEPFGDFRVDDRRVRDELEDGNAQVMGVTFDTETVRLSYGGRDFDILTRSGAPRHASVGGQFVGETALVAFESGRFMDDVGLTLIDQDLNIIWRRRYERLEFERIGGLFQGWAWAYIATPDFFRSEYESGDALISENGDIIQAAQLGFEFIHIESDFSFGDVHFTGHRGSERVNLLLRPDLSTYPMPEGYLQLFPEGLAEACAVPVVHEQGRAIPTCNGPTNVVSFATGEIVIRGTRAGSRFRTGIYNNRYVLNYPTGTLQPGLWELSGERISNPDEALLRLGSFPPHRNCPQCD